MLRTDRDKEDATGQSPARKYWGKYVGFVRDTADPEQRGRVRYYCPEVMGDRDHEDNWLPWALPCYPMAGGFNAGQLLVPPAPADTKVTSVWAGWIEFRQGDPRFPIAVGGFYLREGDFNYAPKLGDAATLLTEPSVTAPVGSQKIRVRGLEVDANGNATITGPTEIEEPPPAADPVYPHNRVYRSPSGHAQEYDDTPDNERVRVFHRAGTYWEMSSDGSLVTKVMGRNFAYITMDDIRNVMGSSLNIINGEDRHQVSGGQEIIVSGTREGVVTGPEQQWNHASFTRTVSGLYLVAAANVEISSSESIRLTAAGGMALGAGERLDLVSLDTSIVGAKTLDLGSLTGVRLHGTAPAATAIEPIVGGASLAAAVAAFAAAIAAGVAPYVSLNPPLPPPATNEAFVFTAIQAAAAALAAGVAASMTIHRVSKV